MAASVLFLLPHPAFGGAERLTAGIIGHLKESGHRPLVAILSALPSMPDCARLWLEPLAPVHRPDRQTALLALIDEADVSVLVICGLSPAYAMLPLIAGARPSLRIVSFQFNARECLAENHAYAPYLDAIIAESLDAAAALFAGDEARLPVTIISSGVDATSIAVRPRRTGELLCIGYVGRFDESKNPIAFTRLAGRFATRRLGDPALHFVMAGAGKRPSRLARNIDDRGLLGDAALADLMDGIDILIVPSLIDGRPLIIQEAQARGIAVIANAVGGIPELVQHEHTGLLVPPDDDDALDKAVLRLLGDDVLRIRLGANGRERVRREGKLADVLPLYAAVILGEAPIAASAY